MKQRLLRRVAFAGIALLVTLGCGVIGFIDNPAPLSGPSYWAGATGVAQPTVTVFLGTTTPVIVTVPATTMPTGPITVTTTPGLPLIGFTVSDPLSTPYYRTGTFYMNSDVYVGGPDGLVFRITGHETQPSPQNDNATYHFVTIRVTNYIDEAVIVPVSDVFFIRRVTQGSDVIMGRWVAQNEPLIARSLPAYETQQLNPLPTDESRDFILGFVVPNGEVQELGMMTDWNRPVEGGLPIWFFMEDDPLGPFADAVQPVPPTPVVLDDSGTQNGGGSGEPGSGAGRWPTTGIVTRGFGCQELYTGIDGAGFGCPADRPWFHNGVDVANTSGTLIWSPVDGAMAYAGPDTGGADCTTLPGSNPPHAGLGNYQRVSDGSTLHYLGHLRDFLVMGGSVATGQPIAEMGSTGCSTGTHLHWMVYENGTLVNPAIWAGPGPSP